MYYYIDTNEKVCVCMCVCTCVCTCVCAHVRVCTCVCVCVCVCAVCVLVIFLVLFQIPESFADCLGGLLSVTGQNVSVKLQAQGDTSFKKVHTSKDINWTKPNNR